jgi:hypothetical protein
MAKSKGPSVSLDSFLDILTCLQGVLILVIISTGIDAAQTKVLIPTPIERISTKKPIYMECRGDLIYPMDIAALGRDAKNKITQMTVAAGGDQMKLLQAMTETRVMNDYYEVDLSYYMLGQLVIKPRKDSTAPGFALEERATMASDNFMTQALKKIDTENERVVLVVRDDSFGVFKVAQRLSFLSKVEVVVQIYDVREPLRFNQNAVLSEG